MVTNSVGLDIGRTAIKAVRVRRSLTGKESVTYCEQALPVKGEDSQGEPQLTSLLREFLRTNRLSGFPLVTALSCRDLFIRTLALPFRDPKKLTQVVPFEVESLIPLPLEEVSVDYQLLGPTVRNGSSERHDGSDVLVAAVPRSTLSEHVRLLSQAGVKPSAIDVDALALYALAQRLGHPGSEVLSNLAMIDIGASKTTVCLIHQGRPTIIRTIGWGGHHLTRVLAERQGCPFAEAEPLKREMTAQQCEPWLTPLVRELQATLHGYETTTRIRLRHGWVSGGGAELKEVPAHLLRQLELEPADTRMFRETICPPAFAIALGLAIKPQPLRINSCLGVGRRSSTINFNRITEETLAKQERAQRRDRRLAVLGGLALLLLGLVDLSVGVITKESRLNELKAALKTQFREQFPGIQASADELDQARISLAGVKKTVAFLGDDQVNVLPLLSKLVQQLPKGLALKVNTLTVERATLQMEAETDSFESVEKVKQGLLAFPGVHDVGISDARVGSASNQVRFRVTVTLGTT